MSPIGTPVPGAFPLTDVSRLPNVTIGYPGERWSDRKAQPPAASAAVGIPPGTAVVPLASAGKLVMRPAQAGDASTQMAVATRTIDVPDINPGSIYNEALGPNEIRNLPIKNGDYILALYSGVLHLTLIIPDTYNPGDLIGWVPGAVPCAGKPGAAGTPSVPTPGAGYGAWGKMSQAGAIGPLFEVSQPYRAVNAANEGVLTVRSLRGQGPF